MSVCATKLCASKRSEVISSHIIDFRIFQSQCSRSCLVNTEVNNPADLVHGGFVERFGMLCRYWHAAEWVRQSADDMLSVKQRAEDARNFSKRREEEAIWWMPGVYLDRNARAGIFRGAMAYEAIILAYAAFAFSPIWIKGWKAKSGERQPDSRDSLSPGRSC